MTLGFEFGLLATVFLLVIFLGIQIQISGLAREIQEIKKNREDV